MTPTEVFAYAWAQWTASPANYLAAHGGRSWKVIEYVELLADALANP